MVPPAISPTNCPFVHFNFCREANFPLRTSKFFQIESKAKLYIFKTPLKQFFAFLFPSLKTQKTKTFEFAALHLTLCSAISPQSWRKSLSNNDERKLLFIPRVTRPIEFHTHFMFFFSPAGVAEKMGEKEVRRWWEEQRWDFDSRGGVGFSFDRLPVCDARTEFRILLISTLRAPLVPAGFVTESYYSKCLSPRLVKG